MSSGFTTPPVYTLIQPSAQPGSQLDMAALGRKISRIARPLDYTAKPITSQFDKLVTVSKIFLDSRYTELQKEVRTLKLSLFWKDHNGVKLREAMAFANQKTNGPNCNCLSCGVAFRVRNSNACQGFICTFRPYFESLLEECKITTKPGAWGHGVEHESAYDSVFDESTHAFVYDVDSHFVTSGIRDWLIFAYGSKLWKEKSIDSMELKKLTMLFEKLYHYDVDGESESGDT
jgi:hypothetical protein